MLKNYSVRFIDEVGRIVLPTEVRSALEFETKTPIEICVNAAKSEIILKKHTFSCVFCGETEKLKTLGKKHICPACQKEIAKL